MVIVKKYKKELLISLLTVLIMSGIVYFYFDMLQEKAVTTFEKNMLDENLLLLNTVRRGLNEKSDVIYDLKINQPKVLALLEMANDPHNRDKTRKELYSSLQPAYAFLKKNGIRQLHFHLPDNISFFRFHKPLKYGDTLKGVRYSIDLVNKTKQIVRGFEEGRIFNGFRNVYPLFYHNKFIATVEVSYSIRAISSMLTKEEKAFYGLIVQKKLVQDKVWKENQEYYLPTQLSDKYLWDKETFKTVHEDQKYFFENLEQIEKILHKKVVPLLEKNKSFLLPFHFNGNDYIAIFQILKNIAKQPAAYIVTLKKNNFFVQNMHSHALTILIAFLINFTAGVLLFIFLKKEKDSKEALSFHSNNDPLTNVLNRRGFETTFEVLQKKYVRDDKPYTLLFLDIDHFKKINDTYGHNIGDAVLQKFAGILKENLRESDVIARWGGEEFIVMPDSADIEAAKLVAEKLRRSIEKFQDEKLPKFTVSIGVAEGKGAMPLETLIKKADSALYQAKGTGRNKVVVYTP